MNYSIKHTLFLKERLSLKSYLLFFVLIIFVSCNHTDNDVSSSRKEKKMEKFKEIELDIQKIYHNYAKALGAAQKENKPIFMLFYTKQCRWCIKLKKNTLKDKKLLSRLNKEYITLLLNKNSDEYPSSFQVDAVPKVYITNKDGEEFTSITGYHQHPRDYLKWFDYVQIELNH